MQLLDSDTAVNVGYGETTLLTYTATADFMGHIRVFIIGFTAFDPTSGLVIFYKIQTGAESYYFGNTGRMSDAVNGNSSPIISSSFYVLSGDIGFIKSGEIVHICIYSGTESAPTADVELYAYPPGGSMVG
jgi:hypothetical protein